MKKGLAVILAAMIVCSSFSCALAEDRKSPWDALGSFFSDSWKEISDWAENTWNEVSGWVESAWGDASGWIEQAWNETSTWAVEIWGDASTWASESYESASDSVTAWWIDTFETVTDTSTSVWEWIKDSAQLSSKQPPRFVKLKSAISAQDEEEAQTAIKEVYDELLREIGIEGADAEKIWDSVCAYADQKGISRITVAKLSLPYLAKLAEDGSAEPSGSIPAVAIAQYLTGVIEKLGVQSDDIANKLVVSLMEVLNGF